jgi:hypothetical protein
MRAFNLVFVLFWSFGAISFASNPDCLAVASLQYTSVAKVVLADEETELTALEKGMIQSTILAHSVSGPLTANQSLDVFNNKKLGGALSGEITYFNVERNGSIQVVARTNYFRNSLDEYGALFSISGNVARLIGTIDNANVYCLQFAGSH